MPACASGRENHACAAPARGPAGDCSRPIVHPGSGFDEHVLDVREFGDLGLRRRIAAQLVSDDLVRHLRTGREYAFEEPFCRGLVTPLLQQDIKFGAVLIDCTPRRIRLAAQRNEHFVEVPDTAWLAADSLDAMCEARAELVATATDRLIAHDDTALEQQFFNITQAELKPEMPAYCLTDDHCWRPVTVIERFHFARLVALSQVLSPSLASGLMAGACRAFRSVAYWPAVGEPLLYLSHP